MELDPIAVILVSADFQRCRNESLFSRVKTGTAGTFSDWHIFYEVGYLGEHFLIGLQYIWLSSAARGQASGLGTFQRKKDCSVVWEEGFCDWPCPGTKRGRWAAS